MNFLSNLFINNLIEFVREYKRIELTYVQIESKNIV